MNFWIELLLSLLVVLGGLFMLVGSIGLSRLPDFYSRLHGPTKGTTLGVGSLLVASMIFFTLQDRIFTIHELLITLFLFISAPISAHMLAKAALHVKTRTSANTQGRAVQEAAEKRTPPSAP